MAESGQDYNPIDGPALLPEDARALDALVEAGFQAGEASLQPGLALDGARIARAGQLLSLLNTTAAAHPSLADATMARILQAQRRTAAAVAGTTEATLSPDDEAALESWVMHGYDASRVAPSLRERARKLEALAALATAPTAMADDSIIDRTLSRIDAFEEETSESRRLPAVRGRGLSVRFADLVSVAAVVLIGAGVIFPVLGAVREQGRRALCNTNLGSTASAMSTYAGANRDSLPITTASLGGGRWWDVGTPQHSNSANLYTLARDGYVNLSTLACPGNPAAPTGPSAPDARDWRRLEEVSYSYQIMFGPRPAWNGGARIVVLADRSPVVLRAIRHEAIDPFANAPNHRGAGQHLLSNDGSVYWATSPTLPSGDNIWLPRAFEVRIRQTKGAPAPLSGRELPDGADDTCLGP